MQSRYYDPEVGRFINPDTYPSTGQGLIGNNMFSYCANNPVMRSDADGQAFDTVLDVISLATSIVDVARNPKDPWAWVGLAGDIIDVAIPLVGGVGESIKAMSKAADVVDKIDDTHDTAKILKYTEGACFVAGTAVLTESGTTAIEKIRVGDQVWAWDESTGTIGLKTVVETYVNSTSELIHLYVGGQKIITTPSHPFYSPVKGWTAAVHLRAGDILVLVNGEYVVVEKVQHEILEAPITVYNFQVEDYHTYYVSNAGVLVHNKCINDYQTKSTIQRSIWFDSERQARNFARTKVGHNPVRTGPGKLVSRNGVWQYRAKLGDILDNHVHLEKLNPETGEVLVNYHLRWKKEGIQ